MHVFDALLQAVDGLLQLRVAREILVLVVELLVADLEARLALENLHFQLITVISR